MTKREYLTRLLVVFLWVSLVYVALRIEKKQIEESMQGQDLQLQFSRRHGQ